MQKVIKELNIGWKIKILNSWYEVIEHAKDHKRKFIPNNYVLRFIEIDKEYAKSLSPIRLKGLSKPRKIVVKLPWILYTFEKLITDENE